MIVANTSGPVSFTVHLDGYLGYYVYDKNALIALNATSVHDPNATSTETWAPGTKVPGTNTTFSFDLQKCTLDWCQRSYAATMSQGGIFRQGEFESDILAIPQMLWMGITIRSCRL